MNNQINRTYYFDYLRILSTFAVIVLHVAAQSIYKSPIASFNWNVLNTYDSLVRWCVPIFVMISGSLFLSKDFILKNLLLKYSLRIVTAFSFWSAAYVLYDILTSTKKMTKVEITGNFIKGEYHLWFCFMIVGLYLLVPFLRKIVSDDKLTRYFLVLGFIFVFLNPQLLDFVSYISKDLRAYVNSALNKVNMNFVCGYVFYFVAGYYIDKINLSKPLRLIIYLLGIIGTAVTIYLTAKNSIEAGKLITVHYNYLSLNVLAAAIALFVFAKYNLNIAPASDKFKIFISKISKYSFGAYLVHIMIMQVLRDLDIFALTFNPILCVPFVSLMIFIISMCISAIINNIPFVKKYIV